MQAGGPAPPPQPSPAVPSQPGQRRSTSPASAAALPSGMGGAPTPSAGATAAHKGPGSRNGPPLRVSRIGAASSSLRRSLSAAPPAGRAAAPAATECTRPSSDAEGAGRETALTAGSRLTESLMREVSDEEEGAASDRSGSSDGGGDGPKGPILSIAEAAREAVRKSKRDMRNALKQAEAADQFARDIADRRGRRCSRRGRAGGGGRGKEPWRRRCCGGRRRRRCRGSR